MQLRPFDTQGVQDRSAFVSKVYTMLGLSLLLAAVGAYYGLELPTALYWPIVIGEFIVLLGCIFLQRSYPLNVLLLSLFTVMTGLTLGPTLNYYVAVGAGEAIPSAATATAVTFGGLSAYVHWSKKDFSFLGGFLFMGLIGMILMGLAGWLFGLAFNTMIFSAFGVLLFSGFILYDTSNMIHRYRDDQYVAATLGLYLDILNLFLMFLRLFAGGRDR